MHRFLRFCACHVVEPRQHPGTVSVLGFSLASASSRMTKRKNVSETCVSRTDSQGTMCICGGEHNTSRYAITFGEVAVLHIGGSEVGGGRREHGFSVSELRELSTKLPQATLQMVSDVLPKCDREGNEAAVLVLRGGAETLLGRPDAADLLWQEQTEIEYDRKFFDRGRTKNKIARHNIVFGEEEQVPSEDYRRFSVRAFKNLPWLNSFRHALEQHLGHKATCLNAEGNHYYNTSCGIGFHGDSERKIVVCLSLGAPSVLRYQWRQPYSSVQFGAAVDLALQHGDVYVMSEKATGFDWKCRSKLRVVHAAGALKYINS